MRMKELSMKRPLWIEVNLKNLQHNVKCIGKTLPWHTEVMAVVKQNAYGHGLIECAKALSKIGIENFGVTSIEEAVALRKQGMEGAIFVLGCVLPEQAGYILEHRLRMFIVERSFAYYLQKEAERRRILVPVHIKIDTGMGRIGVWYKKAEELIDYVASRKNLFIEGIATHFASADADDAFTRLQLKRLLAIVTALRSRKFSVPLVHCANSIAALRFKQSHFNMVRLGMLIYGVNPSDRHNLVQKMGLKPVLAFKSRVVFLKNVHKGMSVSYARKYIAPSKRTIATIACGYADGYPWNISRRAYVLIRGRKAPLAGRVCMDQFMVDTTAIEGLKKGEEAVLIGASREERITAEQLASWAHTIPYQITTCLCDRVPRIYIP